MFSSVNVLSPNEFQVPKGFCMTRYVDHKMTIVSRVFLKNVVHHFYYDENETNFPKLKDFTLLTYRQSWELHISENSFYYV